MAKSFLYRIFKLGRIPRQLANQLEGEGIQLLDEGLKGSVTYRNFRAPGKYFGWRRLGCIASIVLATTRLVGLRNSRIIIDLPLTDPRIGDMRFLLEKNDILVISFGAGLFQQDWSGDIEYRFRTDQAKLFLEKLLEIQLDLSSRK